MARMRKQSGTGLCAAKQTRGSTVRDITDLNSRKRKPGVPITVECRLQMGWANDETAEHISVRLRNGDVIETSGEAAKRTFRKMIALDLVDVGEDAGDYHRPRFVRRRAKG